MRRVIILEVLVLRIFICNKLLILLLQQNKVARVEKVCAVLLIKVDLVCVRFNKPPKNYPLFLYYIDFALIQLINDESALHHLEAIKKTGRAAHSFKGKK